MNSHIKATTQWTMPCRNPVAFGIQFGNGQTQEFAKFPCGLKAGHVGPCTANVTVAQHFASVGGGGQADRTDELKQAAERGTWWRRFMWMLVRLLRSPLRLKF